MVLSLGKIIFVILKENSGDKYELEEVEKTKAQTGYGLIRKDTTYPKETLIMVAL